MLCVPMTFDVAAIRREFPLLSTSVDGRPVVYLDGAATTQKPRAMLDAMDEFYRTQNANPHRGMHPLAEAATVAYEDARKTVATFVNAARPEEIVFTKNCTEALNLVAKTVSRHWKKGDAVVVTTMEHHSNIVPWLQLKEEKGIDVRWAETDAEGHISRSSLHKIFADGKVRMLAITAQSNVLGACPPLTDIIDEAHAGGALVTVDAAQAAAHGPIDVQDLGCDFLAFSGHKVYGPTGIGVLYGRHDLLSALPPFLGGGMMIQTVERDGFSPADVPARFEAGSPPVAEAVGLAAAIRWLRQFRWEDIRKHEERLLSLAIEELSAVEGLRILGPSSVEERSGCISFVIDGVHPHDLTEIIGRKGICLRAGHHCTQPLHRALGIVASSRVSLGIYNNEEDIRAVAPALREAIRTLTA